MSSFDPATKRVLVADDYAVMRQIISKLLQKLGFTQIDVAEDGVEAISYLDKGEYDLILCDWNMPNATGLDVLKHLRAQEKSAGRDNTVFIMVTAEQNPENVKVAVANGVSGYIVKPFNEKGLREKIEIRLGTIKA